MVCVGVAVKRTIYQRKVDVDMLNQLNAVKIVLADVSSVSPSSEQRVNTEACLEAILSLRRREKGHKFYYNFYWRFLKVLFNFIVPVVKPRTVCEKTGAQK